MLHSLKLGRPLLAAAAIFWGVAFGTPANANEITITPQLGASNPETVTVSVTGDVLIGLVDSGGTTAFCSLCAPGTGSFTDATGFLFNGNPTEAAQLLSTESGATFTAVGEGIEFTNLQNPTGTAEDGTFDTAAEFFGIKSDGWMAFFHNISGGLITVSYDAAETGGAGISHVQLFVPGPVVGAGLPGLVLACGGLLALARRRRQQIA
jgi:hypothetical protein